MTLTEKLKFLPDKPGVYIFRNTVGEIIYVGKAISLKKRVNSYFQKCASTPPKIKYIVKRLVDLEYVVTDNEVEALILEDNLIKKYRPRYNVNLKDDKSFPYLKITTTEDFPRVFITRRLTKDGSRYFGPYTQVEAVRETLNLLRRLFPFRTCKREIYAGIETKKTLKEVRPCLNYHIKRCFAPCCGKINKEDYQVLIKEICLFLEGRQENLLKFLKKQMKIAAAKLEFEKAAALRNKLQAVEQITTKQKIVSLKPKDQDIIALAQQKDRACVIMFFIRAGRLSGQEQFFVKNTAEMSEAEVITAVLKQYYCRATFIPSTILLSAAEKEELPGITNWLSFLKGKTVSLQVPRQGEKKNLVALAGENALLALKENLRLKDQLKKENLEISTELTRLLGLAKVPSRIEGFDVSNIQGCDAVASMVVFEEGCPRPDLYRRFRIKTVTGADDYACLREVVKRRLKLNSFNNHKQAKFSCLPDLIIVDGGKGQLAAAKQAVQDCGFAALPVFALAKKEELLYAADRQEPLNLPRNSPAFYFLLRLRDEAHRFAISYHRQLHNKNSLRSLLDEIKGVGPVRRKMLLKYFSSLAEPGRHEAWPAEKLSQVTVKELTGLPGMNRMVAENVCRFFHSTMKEEKENKHG